MNRIFEAVAKGLPAKVGKTFYVSDTTGLYWNELNLQYPPDKDGIQLVYSTVTLALAACTAAKGETVILAPDFTTVLTATEEDNAATKGVIVTWARKEIGGNYWSDRAAAALPASTVGSLFTVTGKVKLLNLVGEVITGISDTAVSVTLSSVPTTGASGSIAGITSVRNNGAGVMWNITGTLATAMGTSTFAGLGQATPLIIAPGAIKIQSTATPAASSVKWHAVYLPIDPGARIIPA